MFAVALKGFNTPPGSRVQSSIANSAVAGPPAMAAAEAAAEDPGGGAAKLRKRFRSNATEPLTLPFLVCLCKGCRCRNDINDGLEGAT